MSCFMHLFQEYIPPSISESFVPQSISISLLTT